MSQFIRRWADWGTAEESQDPERRTTGSLGTPDQGTDKADKSPSVSFVSGLLEHSERQPRRGAIPPHGEFEPETPDQDTDKADKSPSVSFVSGEGAGFGLESSLGGTAAADRQSLLAADVIAMHLDEFATARLRVEVTSDVLGERVVFASDNAKLDPGEPLVVYRAAELRELVGLSASDLRSVHSVKKHFGGTIEPS